MEENDFKNAKNEQHNSSIDKTVNENLSFIEKLKLNIVDDPNAPEFYSLNAIWGFSIFFSPLFSAVLMSMNLNKINRSKYILPVILFGILWYVLSMIILPIESSGAGIIYLWNAIGGLFFLYLFWPKFIGKDLKYRKRSIWIPLIIGIILIIVFVYVMSVQN